MGSAPEVFHQKVTKTQAIFLNGCKTIVIQRGSASCSRDSSSQGRRRVAGKTVCYTWQRMQYFQGSFPTDSCLIPGSGGFQKKLILPWND
jgi:hypothetical protein